MQHNSQGLEKFTARQAQKRHLALVWAQLAGLAPGHIVLDIGSGPGLLAAEYARLVGSQGLVYALDPEMPAPSHAPNMRLLRQSATAPINLPTPPDVVFITDTLHHAASPGAILHQVRALCGPQTRLLVADYAPQAPGLVGAKLARRMAPARLVSLLAQARFSHGAIIPCPDEHYALLAHPA